MNVQYQFFCPPGTPYYDVVQVEDDTLFAVDLPEDWRRSVNEEWTVLTNPARELPEQGWKIHVSATPENAETTLATVAKYCLDHGIAFKHLRGPRTLFFRNSKYGDRGGSGKFMTIFPTDTDELHQVLTELDERLEGAAGPYVLSDLRWRSGPLYVRYGGFTYISGPGPDGTLGPCLRRPDGTLEPDRRKPGFRVPDWVEMPEFLEEAVAARNAGTLTDFPFRVQAALHFSNGGGVYRAVDTRDDAPVLLKEGRPMAGLDEAGADGVTRLERERWALEQLAGVPGIPRLLDYRRGHEHYFLAREFVDGVTLAQAVRERNPLTRGGQAGPEDFADYAAWALLVLDAVELSLAAMHERGVVFGDLHPNNIMVTADDDVAFIDLETADGDVAGFTQRIGAPGFRAPAGIAGAAVDRYALGCTRLSVFLPLTVVLPWQEDKADRMLEQVRAHFPVPDSFASAVRAELAPAAGSAAHPGTGVRLAELSREQLRGRVVAGVHGHATPGRGDRLFPGDIGQFTAEAGGVTFAHGAAGVLWGLHQVGIAPAEEHLQWLYRGVDGSRGMGPELATGLAGVVHALDGMGRHTEAAEVAEHLVTLPADGLGPALGDGVAGTALVLLERSALSGDPALRERAAAMAQGLVPALEGPVEARPRTGLWYGWSGAALMWLRLFEATGADQHLYRAGAALRRDLTTLGWGEDADAPPRWQEHGSLGAGSAGIALVLHEARRHLEQDWVDRAAADLTAAFPRSYLGAGGLLHGRAGTLMALAHLGRDLEDADVRAQVDALDLFAVGDDEQVSFLGQEQLRLSTDLATGSTGILLALEAAHTGHALGLPFLGTSVRPELVGAAAAPGTSS